MNRTCFIHSHQQVTYICLALVELLRLPHKTKKRQAMRTAHFDQVIHGRTCVFCEVLWDLAVEYKVRHRLAHTFWLEDESRNASPEVRKAIQKEALGNRKRAKHLSASSFLAKVPKEKYMPVIDAVLAK